VTVESWESGGGWAWEMSRVSWAVGVPG
jgi:hypothetical protein